MNKSLIVFTLTVLYVSASPLPDDIEEGDVIPLLQIRRYKRQLRGTSFDFKNPGVGTLSHTGTFVNNQNHLLTGTGYATKDFTRGGGILKPDAYGGQVDYSHKPSGSVLGVGADHVRGAGTDVRASGTWNFVNTKNTEVGLNGQYGRHFGAGGSRPDYGVFLKATRRF